MKVKELLADPARWTRGMFARRADNEPVASQSDEACKWCLLGAIRRCYVEGEEYARAHTQLKTAVIKFSGQSRIGVFNDTTTHENLMKVLEDADV